jgi:2-methylcitrate dehydratase
VAKILKLDPERTAHALSLALTPNMALEVVRRGQLTMWKGCAGGNAARNAVFAAQLAAEGMTGPAEVFEGEQGVWNAAGKFEWPPLAPTGGAFRIADTQIKIYPCEYHGQSPIEATLAIRPQIDAREIAAIVVRTYWFAWSEIGSEPAKWEPTTRETADHSIPYLVSAALLDGKVDPSTFTHARIFDPQLRSLIRKVEVIYDKELDKLQPHSNPCRLEITLNSGEKKSSSVDYPKGHIKNPASDEDLERKLSGLASGLLSAREISHLSELCWKLDEIDDVRELVSAMRI